jgi:hypothetical protein
VTLDGADSTTEMIAGTVQTGASTTLVRLVTPVFLSTNTTGTYPATRGLGVLLGAAMAALLAVGWQRARIKKIGMTS